MANGAVWVPERQDIIWIDFDPKDGSVEAGSRKFLPGGL